MATDNLPEFIPTASFQRMPRYQYECEKCGKRFDVMRPIDARAKPACPHCSSKSVRQVLGAFYAKTIKKS